MHVDPISNAPPEASPPLPVKRGLFRFFKAKAYKFFLYPKHLPSLACQGFGKLGAGLSGCAEKVDNVFCNVFSKLYHSVARTTGVMPFQYLSEKMSFSAKPETINQDEIRTYSGTITCNNQTPLPDNSNKGGATRVLAAYLESFNLKIEGKSISKKGEGEAVGSNSVEVIVKHTLEEGEIAILNNLLSGVLHEKCPENKLSQRIHKAFDALIKMKKPKDRKEIYQQVALLRGKVSPKEVKNTIQFIPVITTGIFTADKPLEKVEIVENITSSNGSEWAKKYCTEKGLDGPIDHSRPSECKKNPNLQTSAMNLLKHVIEIKQEGVSSTVTIIRGGAPCSHTKPLTEKLIEDCEKLLGIVVSSEQSTYQRVQVILSSKENMTVEPLKVELQKKMDNSTAQMMARLEAAYKSKKQTDNENPFIHSEMSFLSPGEKKEKSMILDAEMAMENISTNYAIREGEGGDLVKKNTQGSQGIVIILTQMAVNENQITGDLYQERINLRASSQLEKIVAGKGEFDGKERVSALLNEIKDRTLDPDRPYADAEIVHKFNEIYSILGITLGVFCKSGKDRTGQDVVDIAVEDFGRNLSKVKVASSSPDLVGESTLLLAPETNSLPAETKSLKDQIRKKLQKGISLYLTGANTGKENGYAFNRYQLDMLPNCLRPDIIDCNTSVQT